MRRKRILLVNEASFLGTGYGVYGHELLKRLYNTNKYELCELASWCSDEKHIAKITSVPWGIIPNLPREDEKAEYLSNPLNKWGAWKFENSCLAFQPDIVISFRDWWMDEFIDRSPYRRHYHYFGRRYGAVF